MELYVVKNFRNVNFYGFLCLLGYLLQLADARSGLLGVSFCCKIIRQQPRYWRKFGGLKSVDELT